MSWLRAPWMEQRRWLLGLALLDTVLLTSTYNYLFWLRFGRYAGITGSISTLALIWLGLSYLLGRYSKDHRSGNGKSILWITSITTTIVMVLAWLGIAKDPRSLPDFMLPLLGSTATLSAIAQWFLNQKASQTRNWILILTDKEKLLLEESMKEEEKNRHCLNRIVYVDATEALKTFARSKKSYEIAISSKVKLTDEEIEELLKLRSRGSRVLDIVSWHELTFQSVSPGLLSSRWLLLAEGFQLRPNSVGWRVKRLVDIVLSSTLLITCSPIIAAAAFLIMLEDGRPVFYSQRRTGLYGEAFQIWKLRSMRKDAEAGGIQWSKANDRRITKIGYWLRRLRFDEMPQLINVLIGDMSLIGPRPERPEIEIMLEDQIPHYRIRHWIRPGISGWAQVSCPYGASISDSREKLSYDIYYMRNYSISLDILILLKTVRLIAMAKGSEPRRELDQND